MPNLREQSPARIAAGFGGTLNLVLSTIYILAAVLLTSLPWHFYVAGESGRNAVMLREVAGLQSWLQLWLIAGNAGSLLLAGVAVAAPMWIGIRAFRRLELS